MIKILKLNDIEFDVKKKTIVNVKIIVKSRSK